METMSKWNPLTMFQKPHEPHERPRRAATIDQKDEKLTMIQLIQKVPSKRWTPNNPPEFVFHIASRDEWMKNAEVYKPARAFRDVIDCCDEGRIHAYATRNLFYKEYMQKMHALESDSDSYAGRFFNSLNIFSTIARHTTQPASYESMRPDILDRNDHVLLAIDVCYFDECSTFHWTDDEFMYPYLEAPLDKLCAVVEFRVRYDPVNNTLCLPSNAEIRKRMQHMAIAGISRN